MQKQVVALSVITLLLLSVMTGFGYFYIDGKLNAPRQTTIPENKSNPQAQLPAQENTSLQVQSTQGTSDKKTAPSLPSPQEFSTYEKFSSAQNTQYIDVIVGSGEEALAGNSISVVYSGYLTNGQLFDQSRINEEGLIEPFNFQIGGGTVIRGWEEGIVGMKVGGQRRLIIPAELGYGAMGAGDGAIPPNSMLIFDVELVQVQK